jgi:hypothetical protein
VELSPEHCRNAAARPRIEGLGLVIALTISVKVSAVESVIEQRCTIYAARRYIGSTQKVALPRLWSRWRVGLGQLQTGRCSDCAFSLMGCLSFWNCAAGYVDTVNLLNVVSAIVLRLLLLLVLFR